MLTTEYCCEVFPKLIPLFNWFTYVEDNGNKMLCMPYLEIRGEKWRVNYCPSCGKEVRGGTIEKKVYLKLTENV